MSLTKQDDVASCFSYYAGLAEKLDARQWEPVELGEDAFRSAIRREPLGVVVRGCCGVCSMRALASDWPC